MRKISLLLILIHFLISCAPKPKVVLEKEECPYELLSVFKKDERPSKFTVFGKIRYSVFRSPFMISKENDNYFIKVARVKNVSLYKDRICTERRCYLLPFLPEELIFGRFIYGVKNVKCSDGKLIWETKEGVYTKRVSLRRKEIHIKVINNRTGKEAEVILKNYNGKFFRDIIIESGGEKIKIRIEEAKRL